MSVVVVVGTDTGVGKTVFSAGLCTMLDATYWKPVQAGLEDETDSQTISRLSGRPVLPEAYRLRLATSPHLSAEAEHTTIDADRLALPAQLGPLIVEGAGGVMVPLDRSTLYLDVITRWRAPVVLCARTALGTINHTLLSLEALRARCCVVLGVVFIGDPAPEVEHTIQVMGRIPRLGRLPLLTPVTPASLCRAMAAINLTPIQQAIA